ncbi:hypothetical protein [Pseudoalteromonas rhizosphaerae]|uniref:hypothetical protein n=1 Tax=Pseudoalteromonas rhizosphaerae TaxID=2518973 RepID=UPI00237FAD5E|nr:hypothetical protein [Pseudoalteromonas rhizosphaerae]
MKVNVTDIFERLLEACNLRTLKELSLEFGYKTNWASNCRLKEIIPWDVCLKVAIDKKVRIDYLIFGIEEVEKTVEEKSVEFEKGLINGVFNATVYELITPQKGVEITQIADIIHSQIKDLYMTDDLQKKFMHEKLVKEIESHKEKKV